MRFLIVSMCIAPCYIPGILLRYVPFADLVEKKEKRRLCLLYLVCFVVNMLALSVAFSCFGITMKVIRYDIPAFGGAVTLINIWRIPGRTKEHLFVSGISLICTSLLISATLFLGAQIWGQETVESFFLGNLIDMALLFISYWPLKQLLNKTVKPFFAYDAKEYWSGVWVMPIAMYFAMFLNTPDEEQIASVGYLISRVLIAVATLSTCYGIVQDHKRLEEKAAMADQLNMQKVYYARLEERVADARRISHDFKHHISAIQHYIDTDDKDGLQSYCWELGNRPVSGVKIPYTGNRAVDGVIYRYAQLAKERDIEFEYFGSIQNCAIPNVELCVLLGNALDNALTGCMTISKNRYIKIIMQSEEHLTSIVVNNSFDGVVLRKGDALYSRKRENEPGIGMSSMRSICEKYDADMDTKWDDNSFTVLFVIPVE